MSSPSSIRFPDPMRVRIETLAAGERRNFSQMVLILVEEALVGRGQDAGAAIVNDYQEDLRALAPLDEAADPRPDSTPESAASSSGGPSSRAPSGRSRRSTSPGAEPVPTTGAVGDGEAAGTAESAPARTRRPRSGKCPHGVPAGSYCKRCEA